MKLLYILPAIVLLVLPVVIVMGTLSAGQLIIAAVFLAFSIAIMTWYWKRTDEPETAIIPVERSMRPLHILLSILLVLLLATFVMGTLSGGTLIIAIAFLAFWNAVMTWYYARVKDILGQWAKSNGLDILSSEHRWWRRGPLFWTTSRGQHVCYITARTPDGQVKRGWVRCGSSFLGLLVSEAEVRWDE